MNDREIYDLYILQSRNVRHLKKVMNNLFKDINKEFQRDDNEFQINSKTKIIALLYCALSEAQFLQIVYTPKGFTFSEIEQIKNKRSIAESWELMIDLAMNKVGNWNCNNDLFNRRNRIQEIIKTYIKNPQEIRNKIAHGQWIHALNSKSTKENVNTTTSINELNVVTITIWFIVHQYLAYIVRDLVQSPKRGFHHNYWVHLVELEEFLVKSKSWSIENKIDRIRNKGRK
jgi:putative ubiquitin-RnfH superfamily antitoxin RatB of RatAB toxin-antitoxin module